MLLRRVTKHVKDQNWFAVGIDFCIVVIGVFIGIQVANWNEAQADRADTKRTLTLLLPFIENSEAGAAAFKTYYATTKAYGEGALAGWKDETAMSDGAFLISAYQASQIMGGTGDLMVLAQLIGAENIRNIRDPKLQSLLSISLSSPSSVRLDSNLDTPYRRNVRRAIPFEIQEKIRTECGDQHISIGAGTLVLPPDCEIDFPAEIARNAASQLRERLDLRDDLQWHMASIDSTLFNLEIELTRNRPLLNSIKAYLR